MKTRTKVPELANLPQKTKDKLFKLSFQMLEINKQVLDYSFVKDKERYSGYNMPDPKVILREERVCTLHGTSDDLCKDAIDGLDYHNGKELNKFIKYLEKEEFNQEKRRIDGNFEVGKQLSGEDRKRCDEITKKELYRLKNPLHHNIVFTGSITDYMLSDYGLISGASLGTKWWAFTILKYKNRLLSIDAINSGTVYDEITKTLEKDPLASIEKIEDNIATKLTECFYNINPHIKNIFKEK